MTPSSGRRRREVVYNSFNGRYADNPRALYEALRVRCPDPEHGWARGRATPARLPADAVTVPVVGTEATAALEEADVVVANCHLDLVPWRKRRGTLYLQTWHGTPLKCIHRSAKSHRAAP